MRRIIGFLFLLFFLITSGFAFDVYNSDGTFATYFSINNPQVYVKTDQNLTFFNVSYEIFKTNFTNIVDLKNCSNIYCGNFSLLNLINISNNSFNGAIKFLIEVGNEQKVIYLDFEKPKFNLNNFSIIPLDKRLNLNFNFSDNSGIILSVKLYKKDGSNLLFIKDLVNLSSYNYSLTKEGNLSFQFVVEDEAKNSYIFNKDFLIEDFFEPEIIETYVIFKDNSYLLNFNIKDDNLANYEIIQGETKLSGLLVGNLINKEVLVPFNSGNIIFKVLDKAGNQKNKSINLDAKITNNYENKYSNKKIFKFTSDATYCFLENLDNLNVNKAFEKSSNTFSYNLDISKTKLYNISFYCEKEGFRQYFTKDFYYDINEPLKTELKIKKTLDGFLKLNWNESKDSESSIKYKLFKDDKLIYTGNKLEYTDIEVIYPESYGYYLQIIDEANNIVKSNEVKEVPKKVKVFFTSNIEQNLKVDKSDYNLTLNTDKNSKVNVIVKNDGKILSENLINKSISEKLDFNLKFSEGINQVIVQIEDEFGNKLEETFFVTYDLPIVAIQETIKEPVITKKDIIEEPENNTLVVEELKEESSFSYLGFFIMIIFIILISVLFVSNYSGKDNFIKKKIKKNNRFIFDKKVKNDFVLEKSLSKIKSLRIEKQKQIELKKKKENNKKELTEFSKKKHQDLSNSSSFKFDISSLKKHGIRTKREREELEEIIEKRPEILKKSFFNFKKKSNKKKEDDISLYINKVRNSKSWDSTREYLMKTKLEKEKIEQEKIREKEEALNKKIQAEREKKEEQLRKEEEKKRKQEEKEKERYEKNIAKQSLNDYIEKRTKKNRNLFFAEKSVERELKNRKD